MRRQFYCDESRYYLFPLFPRIVRYEQLLVTFSFTAVHLLLTIAGGSLKEKLEAYAELVVINPQFLGFMILMLHSLLAS